MKFIHVSDTHIAPAGQYINGLDPRARLEACVADINAHHGDAEICVFTGDLVDKGEAEAYRVFREILSSLLLPHILLMGNHDDRDNFLSVFPDAGRDENGFVQSAKATSAGDFIFLDTQEAGNDAGIYCEVRRAWLQARLQESRGRTVYLFMHHPPFDIGIPSLDRIRLRNWEPFAELIADHDNIRHLFLGHVHRPVSGSWRGIPFSALRSTNHQVSLDLHTPRPVPKNHEPPAYAVIFLGGDQTVVHFHDYLDDTTLAL